MCVSVSLCGHILQQFGRINDDIFGLVRIFDEIENCRYHKMNKRYLIQKLNNSIIKLWFLASCFFFVKNYMYMYIFTDIYKERYICCVTKQNSQATTWDYILFLFISKHFFLDFFC